MSNEVVDMRNFKCSIFLLLALFCISCGSNGALPPDDPPEPQESLVSGQLTVDSPIFEIDLILSESDSIVDAVINTRTGVDEDGPSYVSLYIDIPFDLPSHPDFYNQCDLDVLEIPIDTSNVTYPVEDVDVTFGVLYGSTTLYTEIRNMENIEGSLEITELSLSEIPWEECVVHREIGHIKGTLSVKGTYHLATPSYNDSSDAHPFNIDYSGSFEAPVSFSNCSI